MKKQIKEWMMENYDNLYDLYVDFCIDTSQTTSARYFHEEFVPHMYSECKH